MGVDHINVCETGLALGLGSKAAAVQVITPAKAATMSFEPSLTLGLYSDEKKQLSGDQLLYRQDSGASSFSNNNVSVKRELRESQQIETGETETTPRVRSRLIISDHELDDDGDGASGIGRKKLRLTKAQSALLEESFKQHATLNPKQKQELARELNLRPRQVEVWFQNRRARTKLKQTEVDCEYLKKCCESLTEENRRLQKEVQELKLAQPTYMQLPAATLTMCPSCERISGDTGAPVAGDNSSKTPLTSSFTTTANPLFYNSFPNPSAAC